MSYSFSATGNRSNIVDAVREQGEAAVTQFNDPPAEEAVRDHVKSAATAVEVIVETLGRPDDELSVSVSGHANPGHAPREGWSNESCSVQVWVSQPQVVPKSEAEADMLDAYNRAAGSEAERAQD